MLQSIVLTWKLHLLSTNSELVTYNKYELNHAREHIATIKFFTPCALAAMFARPARAWWRVRVWAVKSSLWSEQTEASQTRLWEHWGQEGRSGVLVLALVWWPLWVFLHVAVGAPLSSAKQVQDTHTHTHHNSNFICLWIPSFCSSEICACHIWPDRYIICTKSVQWSV